MREEEYLINLSSGNPDKKIENRIDIMTKEYQSSKQRRNIGFKKRFASKT